MLLIAPLRSEKQSEGKGWSLESLYGANNEKKVIKELKRLYLNHCVPFHFILQAAEECHGAASLTVLAAGRTGGVSTPFKNLQSTPDCALVGSRK